MQVHQEKIRYELLKLIEQNPSMGQRALAKTVGISLGSTNYCMKALVEKGYIKAGNFRRSANKKDYLYTLTPEGIEARYQLAIRFLSSKRKEYETLKAEIDTLKAEVQDATKNRSS